MNKLIDILRNLICLILSIILFLLMFFYLILDLAPKLIVKENIKIFANELSTETLIYNGEDTFIDDLNQLFIEHNIDTSVISGILNQSNVKGIVIDYYGELSEAILYNQPAPKFNYVGMANALTHNIKNLFDDLGIIISSEEQDIIIEHFNVYSERISELVPTYEQTVNIIGADNVDSIRALFGPGIKLLFVIVMIMVIALITLVSWSIYKFAIWSGSTTIVAGLTVMILFSLVYDTILNYTNIVITPAVKTLIETNILKTVNATGTTFAIIGAVQILYYLVLRKKTPVQKY